MPEEGALYANQAVYFNCVFYTDAVSESGYISDDSHIVDVASGNEYKLGAYDENNSMYASQKDTEYTMTFAEQVSTSEIRLLYVSAGGNVTVKINYTDDTTDEVVVENVVSTVIYSSHTYDKILSRIFIKKDRLGRIVSNCIALMEMSIPADLSKKVKSLTIIPASDDDHFYLAASYKGYKSTGIEDVAIENQVGTAPMVYPNPVRQGEVIKVAAAGASEISLVSLTGKVIYRAATVNDVAEIPADVAAGVYIVVVKGESGVKTAKVVVR